MPSRKAQDLQATVLAFLVIRLDVFLVNGYLGTEQAWAWRGRCGLAEMMYLLLTVVGLELLPRVARGASVDHTAPAFLPCRCAYNFVIDIPAIAPPDPLQQLADAAGLAELTVQRLQPGNAYDLPNHSPRRFPSRQR